MTNSQKQMIGFIDQLAKESGQTTLCESIKQGYILCMESSARTKRAMIAAHDAKSKRDHAKQRTLNYIGNLDRIIWDSESRMARFIDNDILLRENGLYAKDHRYDESSTEYNECVYYNPVFTTKKIQANPSMYLNCGYDMVSELANVFKSGTPFKVGHVRRPSGMCKIIVKYGDTLYTAHYTDLPNWDALNDESVPSVVYELIGNKYGSSFRFRDSVILARKDDGTDDLADVFGDTATIADMRSRAESGVKHPRPRNLDDADDEERYKMFNKWRKNHEVGGDSFTQAPKYDDPDAIDPSGMSLSDYADADDYDNDDPDYFPLHSNWNETVNHGAGIDEMYGDIDDNDEEYYDASVAHRSRLGADEHKSGSLVLGRSNPHFNARQLAASGRARARVKAKLDAKKLLDQRLDNPPLAPGELPKNPKIGRGFNDALRDYKNDLVNPIGARPYDEDDEIDENNWIYGGNQHTDDYDRDEDAEYWYGDIEQ